MDEILRTVGRIRHVNGDRVATELLQPGAHRQSEASRTVIVNVANGSAVAADVAQQLFGLVGRMVVDDDDFALDTGRTQLVLQIAQRCNDCSRLVVSGNNNRKLHR